MGVRLQLGFSDDIPEHTCIGIWEFYVPPDHAHNKMYFEWENRLKYSIHSMQRIT